MLSKTIAKYIQSLAYKKFRDEHRVFIAEGPKVVTELLVSGKFILKMVCAYSSWLDENKKLLINFDDGQIIPINEIELEKISMLQTPNKVVAVFYKNEEKIPQLKNNISLMLDEIQDPGNLGTILRTADWFGIKNVICSYECVDCYSPKVVQASMGSLGRVNTVYTVLNKFIETNKNVKVYAAALSGKDISSLQKITEGILLIGNESKGIKENLLKFAHEIITIKKQGQAESLNAAVACGIILSHLV